MPFTDEVWDGFVDEWLEKQEAPRINVIVSRALRDAKLDAIPEEDSYDYDHKFFPAFNTIAAQMAFSDFYHDMAEDGLMEPYVEEDGTVGYRLTELGAEALAAEEADEVTA